MCKGTNFISEIGKYFKENNALNAMNNITSMMENVTFSESVFFLEREANSTASSPSCRCFSCC